MDSSVEHVEHVEHVQRVEQNGQKDHRNDVAFLDFESPVGVLNENGVETPALGSEAGLDRIVSEDKKIANESVNEFPARDVSVPVKYRDDSVPLILAMLHQRICENERLQEKLRLLESSWRDDTHNVVSALDQRNERITNLQKQVETLEQRLATRKELATKEIQDLERTFLDSRERMVGDLVRLQSKAKVTDQVLSNWMVKASRESRSAKILLNLIDLERRYARNKPLIGGPLTEAMTKLSGQGGKLAPTLRENLPSVLLGNGSDLDFNPVRIQSIDTLKAEVFSRENDLVRACFLQAVGERPGFLGCVRSMLAPLVPFPLIHRWMLRKRSDAMNAMRLVREGLVSWEADKIGAAYTSFAQLPKYPRAVLADVSPALEYAVTARLFLDVLHAEHQYLRFSEQREA